ncbi:2'-phosphotransferase [Geosmithia morbida]|uniref:2'-phosphotransferase n=1 Tax=Geosmithia morbida TaxID=1094350 RepID=A0A9P4YYX1_9HYPO|nr:2'-phosphotransferase [Geosmithia morbida]KAF4124213.1 2'-phosphotransferase [Geosmithia morbida]
MDYDSNEAVLSIQDAIQDSIPTKGPKSRNGRGGKRHGGGRGQPREVQVSKALSKLLRHQADSAGIQLDGEGFARLDAVLRWGPIKSLGVTVQEVRDVVGSNDKQRFLLKGTATTASAPPSESDDASRYLIRANQGHSIKVESSSLLRPIAVPEDVPPLVVHGTYYAFWPAIVEAGGLKAMGRTHVHCSTGTPEDGKGGVISGMRRDAELLVEIDVARSMEEGGLKWWRSDNGVILSEGDDEAGLVSSKFFRSVRGRGGDVGVLWENGQWVADLPEGLKIRAPHGKGSGRGGGRQGQRRKEKSNDGQPS